MRHRDLRLVIAATAACALISLLTPLGEARIVVALPLTLLLPGYAIAAAIFARGSLGLAAIPVGLAAGLAVLTLGGIALNYLPGGIRAVPWALLLFLVVVASCLVAARRRRAPAAPTPLPASLPRLKPGALVLYAGALVLAAAALVLAQTNVPADRAFGYGALWLAQPTADGVARVGVTNQNQDPVAYRLQISLDGDPRPIVRRFRLEPGDTAIVPVAAPPSAQPRRLEAKLFLSRRPGVVYRMVDGSIPPRRGEP